MPEESLDAQVARYNEFLKQREKDALQQSVSATGTFGAPATVGKAITLQQQVGADPIQALDPEVQKIYEHTAKVTGVPVEKLVGTRTAKWAQQNPLHFDLLNGQFDTLLSVEDQLKKAESARVDAENEKNGRGFFGGVATMLAYGTNNFGALPLNMAQTLYNAFAAPGNQISDANVDLYAQALGASQPGLTAFNVMKNNAKWLESKKRATESALLTDPRTGEQIINWGAVNPLSLHGIENITDMVAGEAVPMLAQYLIGAASAPVTGPGGVAAVTVANAGKIAKVGAFAKAVWAYAKSSVSVVNASRVVTGNAQQGVQEMMAKGMTEEEAWRVVAPGALLAGLFSGAAGSPIEAKIMEDLFTKVAKSPWGATFAARARQRLASFAAQGAKEGMQEVMEGLGEDLAAYITYQPDKTAKEWASNAIMNFVGGASMGGLMGGVLHGSQAAHAAQNAAFIQSLHDEKLRSEFVKHAPAKYGEFVQQVTEGGSLDNLLIDAQGLMRYYQTERGLSAEEVRAFATGKLGVTGEDFDMAIKNGSDLVVPTGHYANEIAGTDDFQSIYDMTRVFQGGPTIAEVHNTFAQEQVQEEQRKAMAALPAEDPEREHVRQQIAGMLMQATSALTERQAGEVADSYARVLAIQAPRVKKTIAQLFKQEQLNITKDIHAKLDAQYGADYALTERTSRPDLGTTPAEVPATEGGRASARVSPLAGRVPGGSRQGAEGRARSQVGRGVQPPASLWHGTVATGFGALKAEGLGASVSGSMGPGLHLSAGPDVSLAYAEGNPNGLWRATLRSNYTPFDASLETSYTPAEAVQFGVLTATNLSGGELWAIMQAELGGPDAAAEFLKAKGFDGLYYNHGGEDAWSVWRDDRIVGSRPTTIEQARADYAVQGSRRDVITGQLKVAQSRLWQSVTVRSGKETLVKFGLDPSKRYTIRDVAAALEARQRAKYGRIALNDRTPETQKKIAGWMVEEIMFELQHPDVSAVGWYTTKFQNALDIFAKKFPELKTDKQARNTLTALIAICSDGQEVDPNFRQALDIYERYRKDGTLTIGRGHSRDISNNLRKLGDLLTKFGPEGTHKFLMQESTVGALKAMAKASGSEFGSDYQAHVKLPMAAGIFGPKLGAFYANLMGAEGYLTMDRWWSRTFNRYRGDLQTFPTSSAVARFQELTGATYASNEELLNAASQWEKSYHNRTDQNGGKKAFWTQLEVLVGSKPGKTAASKSEFDKKVAALDLTDEQRAALIKEGDTEKVGNQIFKDLRGLRDIPEGAPDRSMMIDTVKEAQKKLSRKGVKMTVADIQAVLWYYEKRLYGELGAKGATDVSYEDVANKIVGNPTTKLFQSTNPMFEGQLTAESMPGGNVRSGIFPGIANATPEQLESYHAEKMGIVLNALRDAGISVDETKQGHGYWDGESNPVTAFVLRVTDEAQLNEAAQIAADVMNDQDAVAWNAKPDPNAPVEEHNAVSVDLGRPLSKGELLDLGRALEASGLPVFPDASDPASIRIVAFDFTPSPETAAQLHSRIAEVVASVVPADVDLKLVSYKATSNLVERGAFDAKAESNTGTEGAPSLQDRAVRRGRKEVEKLNERYFTQHGWGDAGAGAGRGGVPVFQARGRGKHAVEAHAVHYGNAEGLTALGGSFYGQGSAGRERQRLSTEPSDSPLLKRTYGYLSEDGGLPAKERVVKGDIPYEFVATNLYDLEADPEGIRTAHPGDGNAIEHAIIAGGYDGYISPAAGVPGKAIVMLGHDTIPVRPHGGKLDITNDQGGVTRVAQPAYHGSPYKFDKFTLDHIGKGEGAQAFGWGLYFAGDQSVARYYHEQLASVTRAHNTIDGKRITKGLLEKLKKDSNPYVRDFFLHSGGVHAAGIRNIAVSLNGTIEEALENAEHFRQREQDLKNPNIVSATYTSESMAKQAEFYEKKAAELTALKERLGYNKEAKGGQLYKVDVPEDSQLLHQDRELKDQPIEVRDALNRLFDSPMMRSVAETQGVPIEDLKDFALPENHLGRTIYWRLEKYLGSDKAASEALASVGIKGMTYLDGNSRYTGGYGQPRTSHNYVIFDAEAIKTLETYYAGEKGAERGFLEFATNPKTGEPRQFNLALLEGEDKSTIFHELGHFYLELLGDMADDPNADQSVKEDYAKILKWFGVENRSQITTAMHEKFADGHLVYLMEGKAPVPEIQSSFRNFSRWLSKLARTLAEQGRSMLGVKVDMNDEVRGVFDRLYAAESEIEEASKDITKMFTTAEQAGMSQAEFQVYSKAVAKEVDAAKERLTTKLMRQLAREQKADYKEAFATLKAQVTAEVNARPEYAALLAITSGKMADGETEVPKLRTAWLVERYGREILTKLGTEGITRVYGPEGVDGDALAAHLNLFDGSGDALVQALTDLPSRTQVINEQTKTLIQETHPDLLRDPAALREAAQEILMGEGRDKVLATELLALRRKQAEMRPAVRQAVGQANEEATTQARAAATDREALAQEQQRISADNDARARQASVFQKLQGFRLAASAHVSRMKAWELRPDRFLAAQRKHGNEAYRAALKGDYDTAAQAKEREMLSHFLYKETLDAKRMAEDFRTWVKRNDSATVRGNMGKAGGSYLAQFDALRDRFSIERETNERIANRESLGEWVQQRMANAEDTVIAPWLLDELELRNYRQLTVAELRDLKDALKNIKHLAYQELGTIIDGKRVAYETMLDELEAAALTNLPGAKKILSAGDVRRNKKSYKAGALLQGLDATMVKIEQLVNWIDGKDVNGPAHRYIWDRVSKAQDEDYKLTLAVNKVVLDAYEAMPKEYRESMDETFEIGLDHPTSRAEIITMLLYNGQQTRYEKLMQGNAGMGLNNETLARAFAKLGPNDFKLVSAIWQSFDTMKPLVLDLEERLTGIRPKWEENRSFDVYDENGRLSARLEGGYFPLVADPFLNGQIAKKQEGGTVQQIMTANGYSRATTSTGHTKELTGKTYPLMLDFHRIMTAELTNQIKDLTHREVVLSLNRLFSNDRFSKLIKEHIGEAYEAQLMPWLVNIANDRNAGASAGMSGPNRLMAALKANTAAAVIGFKFSSFIVQLSDITRVIAPGDYGVSPKKLLSAMAQLMTNNTKLVEMITDLSPEMAQRKDNLDRDLRSRLNELKGDTSVSAKVSRAAFAGLGMMDAFVSWPAWLASYQQSMEKHGDQEQAVKEADRTVRMKLMTSAPKDLVTIQANKNPWVQLVTMFMGDATSNYNALRNAGHNINGMKGIPTFSGVLLAVIMANIIGDLLKGQWPEDKEDVEGWLLRKAVTAPMGTAPIVRDFGSVMDNALAGKPFTDWRFSPAVGTLTKVAHALSVNPIRYADGKDDLGDFILKEVEATGYLLGIPGTAQAAGTTKYLKHYVEGEENPDNILEFGKGVTTGKGKK